MGIINDVSLLGLTAVVIYERYYDVQSTWLERQCMHTLNIHHCFQTRLSHSVSFSHSIFPPLSLFRSLSFYQSKARSPSIPMFVNVQPNSCFYVTVEKYKCVCVLASMFAVCPYIAMEVTCLNSKDKFETPMVCNEGVYQQLTKSNFCDKERGQHTWCMSYQAVKLLNVCVLVPQPKTWTVHSNAVWSIFYLTMPVTNPLCVILYKGMLQSS